MDWLASNYIYIYPSYANFIIQYSLELNIHQQILSDIASNVGETIDDITYTKDLIASKVQTRKDLKVDRMPGGDREDEEGARVFMVCHFDVSYTVFVVKTL